MRGSRVGFKRNIFRSGAYIRHFNPDSADNPFYRIYQQKRRDTIEIIGERQGDEMILDVGGGMGRIALAVEKRNSRKRVVLMDIGADMLRLAAGRHDALGRVMATNADAHALPFRAHSFDGIIGLDVLCHLENPPAALREFHRVLRPQGTLILDNTNGNPLWVLFYPKYLGKNPLNWLRIMRFHGVYPGWQEIVRHYRKKAFISLLRENGFSPTKSLSYGPLVCPKWHLVVCARV